MHIDLNGQVGQAVNKPIHLNHVDVLLCVLVVQLALNAEEAHLDVILNIK